MLTHIAVMTILDKVIERSENPYLRSYKALPANILYKILDDFVKDHKTQIHDGEFHIVLNLDNLTARIEGSIKQYLLRDEVGLLIRHNASKTTIRELTGFNNNDIIDRRKRMGVITNNFGRPKILDKKEISMVRQMWEQGDFTPVMRIVSISMHTGIRIDDIWNAVRDGSKKTKDSDQNARKLH